MSETARLKGLARPWCSAHNWREEVARMFRFPRNNGIAEGSHRKMKLIQWRAYGFRNFEITDCVCAFCAAEMAGELFRNLSEKCPLKGLAPVFGVEPGKGGCAVPCRRRVQPQGLTARPLGFQWIKTGPSAVAGGP